MDDCAIGSPDESWIVEAHCRGTATWGADQATVSLGGRDLTYSMPLSRDFHGRKPSLQPGMEVEVSIDAKWHHPTIDLGSLGLDVWELRDSTGRLVLAGWGGLSPDWVVEDFSVEDLLSRFFVGEMLTVTPDCEYRYEEGCTGSEVVESCPGLALAGGDAGNGDFVLATAGSEYAVSWMIRDVVSIGEASRMCADVGYVDRYVAEFVRLE